MTVTHSVGLTNREISTAPRWVVKTGDAWDLSASLGPGTVNTIVTSPPYWGLRSYGHHHNARVLDEWKAEGDPGAPSYEWYRDHGGVLGLEPYPEWFVSNLVDLFSRLGQSLTSDGSIWVNLGDTYFGRWSSIREDGRQGLSSGERKRRVTPSGGVLHDKQLLMLPARFAIAMQEQGWILRNDLIWSKPNTPPRPERDRLRASHEHFFHFVKRSPHGRPAYFYDLDEAEPGARDVVTVPNERSEAGHSATFPVALVRPRITSSTPLDGLVLDPFCGTGTTLVSAINEGRRAVGFELSSTYADVAETRLRALDSLREKQPATAS